MDWDFILIIGIGGAIAGGLGLTLALVSHKIGGWVMGKRVLAFLQGKRENIVILDGERVNVNKFRWKDHDKQMQYFEVKPYVTYVKPIQEQPVLIHQPEVPKEPIRKFKQLSDYR